MTQVDPKRVAPLKPVARDYIQAVPLATLAPAEASDVHWMDDFLDNQGGSQHFMHDLRTDEGLDNYISFNELSAEWKEVQKKKHHSHTTKGQKMYDALYLVAQTRTNKKLKNNKYLHPIEMLHRLIAALRVLTRSEANHFTARVKWNTLKVNHFLESGLQGTVTLTEEQLKTAIDESLAVGNDDDMLGEVLTVP